MVRDTRGSNLLESLPPVVALSGAAAGFFLGDGHGAFARLGLAALGFVLGSYSVLLLPIPLALLARLEPPPLPRCFNGTCQSSDYTWDLQAASKLCRCRCGDLYRLHDDRFLRHFGEGLQLPYMKRDRHRRWQPEVRVRQAGSV